ncbi:hypothetical protein FGO68_gene7740 [Halteria grandinella]|uniref:Uncharacterized protein n=1 Tax=Halteria grandinella TaxID=5974 RepID=A0A8J8NLC2_HALGN|nr:hypothetical protein FGO68_gene7740 [Halteria grandinella]
MGTLGKLPKSNDIRSSVGDQYDILSAFQTYFVFNGELYQLITFFQPYDKISKTGLKDINCHLVFANEHIFISRKACSEMNEIIMKHKKFKKAFVVHNTSVAAHEEYWPGQLQQEKEHLTENVTAVQDLKSTLISRPDIKIIEIKEFSNETFAQIFIHVLKVCKSHY